LKIVKALIARHVDMNALTNDGQTALGIARRKKHPSIISYLQSLGAIDDGIVDEEEEEKRTRERRRRCCVACCVEC
jgi:ankyrin repeat protein